MQASTTGEPEGNGRTGKQWENRKAMGEPESNRRTGKQWENRKATGEPEGNRRTARQEGEQEGKQENRKATGEPEGNRRTARQEGEQEGKQENRKATGEPEGNRRTGRQSGMLKGDWRAGETESRNEGERGHKNKRPALPLCGNRQQSTRQAIRGIQVNSPSATYSFWQAGLLAKDDPSGVDPNLNARDPLWCRPHSNRAGAL